MFPALWATEGALRASVAKSLSKQPVFIRPALTGLDTLLTGSMFRTQPPILPRQKYPCESPRFYKSCVSAADHHCALWEEFITAERISGLGIPTLVGRLIGFRPVQRAEARIHQRQRNGRRCLFFTGSTHMHWAEYSGFLPEIPKTTPSMAAEWGINPKMLWG